MSTRRKTLYSGTIGTTETVIYKVPVNSSTSIVSVTVVNILNATVKLNLIKKSTDSVHLYAKDLQYAPYYFSKDNTEYILGLGDSLTAVSDTADALEITISGYEEPANNTNATS